MIFASVDPATLNTDPAPWQALAGGDRGARCDDNVRPGFDRLGIEYRYNPRPEYIPATTHPVNPILADLRKSDYDAAQFLAALDFLHPLPAGTGHRIEPSHVDHARRVLTRLANWKEAN